MEGKNDKWVFAVSVFLLIVAIIMLGLTSCSPQRQLINLEVKHPELLAGYCADKFNPKIDTLLIRGKDSVTQSYVYIDCDTVKISDTLLKTRIVKAICPPSVYRVDTFYSTVENTAKIAALQATNDKLNKDVTDANLSAAKSRKSSTIWMWLFIGHLIVDVLVVYLLFRKVTNLRNILDLNKIS